MARRRELSCCWYFAIPLDDILIDKSFFLTSSYSILLNNAAHWVYPHR